MSEAPPEKESIDCSVTVVVRSRPINDRERKLSPGGNAGVCVEFFGGHTVKVTNPKEAGKVNTFTFDYAYNSTDPSHPEFVNQEKIFQDIGARVLNAAMEGYNTCIFAYGQTGSGKTYTMLGPGGGRESRSDPGLIPRICTSLFERCTAAMEENKKAKLTELDLAPPTLEFKIEVTYLEIYNERVRCLLNPKKENLKVRQHNVTGVYVEDLTQMLAVDYDQVFNFMNEGNNARTVAATNMNDRSSRSHAIFSLIVTQTRTITTRAGVTKSDRVSRINLVDLAGSERAKATGAEGDRLKEGAQINQSLTTLGLVISGLAEQSKQRAGDGTKKVFIPYRDSTLTWLLKENLGGNSKTFMVSAISPADINYDETLSTLRYADRAKSIVTRACVNEDPNAKMIRDLRSEIEEYKRKLFSMEERMQAAEREKEALKELERQQRAAAPRKPPTPQSEPLQPDASDASDTVVSPVHPKPMIPKLSLGRLGSAGLTETSQSPQRNVLSSNYTPDVAIDTVLTARGQSVTQEEDDILSLTVRNSIDPGEESAVVSALRQRLAITEKILHEMNQTWEDKKVKTELENEARVDAMNELHITVKADKKLPHVMNLMAGEDGDDWIVKYLRHGNTYVGTDEREDGVSLHGDGIAACHFILVYKDGQNGVLLHPIHGAETYVDNSLVTETTVLSSGNVIAIGAKLLRFIDPSVPTTARGRSATILADRSKLQAYKNRTIDLIEGKAPEPITPMETSTSMVSILTLQQSNPNIQPQQSPTSSAQQNPVPVVPPLPLTGITNNNNALPPNPDSPSSMATSTNPSTTARTAAGTVSGGNTTRRLTLIPRVQDETVLVLKYNLVFVGPRGAGKTTLKKSFYSELKWYESKKCVPVTPTVSVEITKETVTVGTDRVEIIMSDLCGSEDMLPTHAFCLPESRSVLVLTFNLLNSMDIPTLKPWIELLQVRCPGCSLFLIGTHKDECKDAETTQTLNGVESAVEDYLRMIEKDESVRIRIAGCAAVSNKDRTAFMTSRHRKIPQASIKLKELLQIMAKHSMDLWRVDPEYMGGFVPARILTLQRRVAELRSQGSWTVSGLEFKHTASLIDSRYHYDVEELAHHTNVLHVWRSLIHFRANAMLQRHVFFEAELVLRMVSQLYAVIYNFNAVSVAGPMMLSAKDRDEIEKGILSVCNAAVIFRSFLNQLKKVDKDVKLCLEVLTMFDIVYPVSTPTSLVLPTSAFPQRRPSVSATTTTVTKSVTPNTKVHVQSSASTSPVVEYFLIPEVFQGTIPNCIPSSFEELLHGLHKKYTFNVLPAGFFPRLVARLSRVVTRVFQGAISDFNASVGKANLFWRHAVWLQDGASARALVRTHQKSIFVSLSSVSEDPLHPSFQLLGAIDNSLKMLALEYKGVKVEESVRCINRECRSWLLLGKDLHVGGVAEIVFCPTCKKAFSHTDVVTNAYESVEVLYECKRNALHKVAGNLNVDLTVEARKELRLIAEEYYAAPSQSRNDSGAEMSGSDAEGQPPSASGSDAEGDAAIPRNRSHRKLKKKFGSGGMLMEPEEVGALDRILEIMLNTIV